MGWRSAVRRAIGWLVGPPLVLLAAVLGTGVALLYTPPGRALTARAVTDLITARVRGQVEIGAIGGGLLRRVVLERVAIRDTAGVTVLATPRLEARYQLLELLAGRIVIRGLEVDAPQLHLVMRRGGRWNYQEVFRSGEGAGSGAPPLVELRDLTLTGGSIRVDVPTTPGPPREPMSRHAAAPAQPEVIAGGDGPLRVYRATNVNAQLPRVRVSTPEREPILAEFQRFAAVLSDPAVQVVDARGELLTKGDSLRFELEQARLPGTVLAGQGAVRWPEDTIRYDFALAADTVALRDLRWIQPDFPDWEGRGRVTALSRSNRHTEFALSELTLGDGRARAEGDVITILDEDLGFGVRDLDMALRDVPLDVMRPYLDTLPFQGTITGRLRASGYRSLMQLGGELRFLDVLPPTPADNALAFEGGVRFGGEAGAVFDGFTLREALLDLATVRAQVPAVVLPGQLRLVGRLDGPWQNATFEGTAEHLAPNAAVSRMTGTVRLDTRDTVLGISLDALFDQLSFDALRTGYPDLTVRGGVSGRITAEGRLDALAITANVAGDVGDVVAEGVVGIAERGYRFSNLALDVRRLDVGALTGRPTNTALSGRMVLDGVVDSGRAPTGRAVVELGQSRIEGFTLSGITGTIHSDGSLLTLDSTRVEWPDGRLVAHGTLGWTSADSGHLVIAASEFSVAPFDSLVRASLPLPVDTVTPLPLAGTGHGRFDITGSIEAPRIAGGFTLDSVRLDGWRLGTLRGTVRADSLSTRGLALAVEADSLAKGRHVGTDLRLALDGTADSLHVTGSGALRGSRLAVAGWRVPADGADRYGVDSLQLDLPNQRWSLREPVRLLSTARRLEFADTLALVTRDGSGTVLLSGQVPGDGSGELAASVVGLDLRDMHAVMGRDTTRISGQAQLDFRLGGTREAPTLRGSAMVTGLRLGESAPPLVRAAYDYRDRVLRANLRFWKLGETVLEVDGEVPFDLALAARARRQLPGPIEIHAIADSADLAILEAFTPSVRSTTGAMSLDLAITGSWDRPSLQGHAGVIQGRTTIPNLGVRYGPINGTAHFAGDSMVVDSLHLASGEGELAIAGSVRFATLSTALLDLRIRSDRFLAINTPGFMVARPTGEVTLTGTLSQPVLRGSTVRLTESDIYFADMITKNVIDLEDPRYRSFVDLEEIRRMRLGTPFQNRFLDSLRIENLQVVVGPDVWLRSAEAEIQLEGTVQVSKQRRNYIVAGELNTPRGEYTLDIRGLVSRKFIIDRGTVRYFGTSDLNAELDIQATHRVRAYDGDEVPIEARITGTLQVPRVELSAPGRNIASADIVSYLVFGRSEAQLAASDTRGTGASLAAQAALTAVVGELERRVVQEGGVGLDLLEFRPALSPDGSTSGFSRFAAGMQLGSRWFVSLNAGFCLGGEQAGPITARNFGASIEYRFARDWRVQASAEPVQACVGTRLSDAINTIARRYQFGADLFWEREY